MLDTRIYRNVVVEDDPAHFTGEYSYDGKRWYRFAATRSLHHIQIACASVECAERVWAVQDGYGSPGFVPAQGWDWSGIRDSSDEAIAAMWEIAREYITDAEIASALGLEA